MILLLTIAVPLAAGILLPLFRFRSERARTVYVLTAAAAAAALAAWLLTHLPAEKVTLWTLSGALSMTFRADGLSAVFAGLMAFLWPFACLYAGEYMRHEQRPNAFFAWYLLSFAAAMGVAFAANLFTMYLAYECLTLTTLPLVTHKQDEVSIRAGRIYTLSTIGGAALGFAGMMLVYVKGGTGDFVHGGIAALAEQPELMRWAFLAAFFGFSVKAAVFPLYAWLPAASVAPTPVTALLHAVAVVNAGAFAVLRVIYDVFGPGLLAGTLQQRIALAAACFTVVLAAVLAVREQHLKRRLAYSTVSNLSYMVMGACLMTADGMTGSLTHMVCHSLMKITLFYCAGAFLVQTGREWVQEVRGFGRVMPFTCGVFAVAATALVGIPPLCGFVSKWNLLTAAGAAGGASGVVSIAAVIISSVLTAVYALGPVFLMFFRPLNPDGGMQAGEKRDPGWQMRVTLTVLCAGIVILGVASGPLVRLLRAVSAGKI